MPIKSSRPIMPAEELVRRIPVSENLLEQVRNHRAQIAKVICGASPQWLVILGPCSAWPADAVIAYARKLAKLSVEVSEALLLVMRTYVQKPRTTKGWPGPLNQPNPFTPPDIEAGMSYCRAMMRDVLELGLPLADEALFTHNAGGFLPLISWVAIGARSSEDPEHRNFASMIDCPVGMKNPTSGDYGIGVNSVIAAQHGHTFTLDRQQVISTGNPHAHLVLRGGYQTGPNYHPRFIIGAAEAMEKARVKNPSIIVDASHDNAMLDGKKLYAQQIHVVDELLGYAREKNEGYGKIRRVLRGFMIESNLKPGCQKIEGMKPGQIDMGGLSITDPCIGWQETEALVYRIAETWGSIH